MSEPVKTVLWSGTYVKLVKSTGYTTYSGGNKTYRPGSVYYEYKSTQDGYTFGLHSLQQSPNAVMQEELKKAGQTWGRLTPEILAKLIEKVQKLDAEVPAKRKAKKEQQDAEEAAKKLARETAQKKRAERIAKALKVKTRIDTILNVPAGLFPNEETEFAKLVAELLDYTVCGGPCQRSLPRSFYGSCCGYGSSRTNDYCGKPICKDCIEAGESLPHDNPKSLFPLSTLFCSHHALETHAAHAEILKSKKAKATA